jgi:hypothetical protein
MRVLGGGGGRGQHTFAGGFGDEVVGAAVLLSCWSCLWRCFLPAGVLVVLRRSWCCCRALGCVRCLPGLQSAPVGLLVWWREARRRVFAAAATDQERGPVARQHGRCGDLLSSCVVSEAQQRCEMLARAWRTWRELVTGLGAGARHEPRGKAGSCDSTGGPGVAPVCMLAGGRVSTARACEVRCLGAVRCMSERTAHLRREPEEQPARAGRGRKHFAGCCSVGVVRSCVLGVSAELLGVCFGQAASFGAAGAREART